MVVASDSNTWFIELLLKRFEMDDVVSSVYSNPAAWDQSDKMLSLEP